MANPTPRADALRAMREAKFDAAQRLIKEAGKAVAPVAPAKVKTGETARTKPAAKPAENAVLDLQMAETPAARSTAEAPLSEAKPAMTKKAKEKASKAGTDKKVDRKTSAKKSSAKKA